MKTDGMTYAPKGKPRPVVKPGAFVFSAMALDHGHIQGMCNGLTEAGATLKYVWDPDKDKVQQFLAAFPQAIPAESREQVLLDPDTRLIAAAAIPNLRCPLGIEVMEAGKDYFTDKTPLVSLRQLEDARAAVRRTGKKYMVYYSERIHNEGAMFAGELVEKNAIGRVVQVIGLGPHRLNAAARPPWFFDREQYGGILCDIGSHQIEQFLHYAGARSAQVMRSQVANFAHPEHPELEDFGEAMLVADNGATNYFRVDWFTPEGLRTWGDGRAMILGTEGYIEIRKYIDITMEDPQGDQVLLVNRQGEQRFSVAGQVGFPFFGQLILDCLNRTEQAMSQEHAFLAAELCVRAQMQAARLG